LTGAKVVLSAPIRPLQTCSIACLLVFAAFYCHGIFDQLQEERCGSFAVYIHFNDRISKLLIYECRRHSCCEQLPQFSKHSKSSDLLRKSLFFYPTL
ncbi:MAG: hypothetical protein Q4F21_04400, partial [Lachnospiraceae bacterium]|nr:hypothetical protein [Lachnospiraceae bacterium]